MEAVCPQCSMRYEVGEELLQQGTPVLCPACQVPLNLVQPGTNILLEQQPGGAAPSQPDQPAEPQPPAEPGQSWDSGDLLWGNQTAGSDAPPAEPAQPEQASPPPPEEPSAAPSPPDEPRPDDPWGSLTVQPQETQTDQPPAEEPPAEPEIASFETPTWDSAPAAPQTEPPAPEAAPEEPPAPVEEPPIEEPPIEVEEPPAEPAVEEQAPVTEPPVEEPPAEPAPEPEAPEVPAPAAQPEPPAQQAKPSSAIPGADDWAAAAAQWAASGFSTESMPTFIKDKDAAKETPAPAGPDAEPAAEPPGESSPAAAPQVAQPFQQPAPPPLPRDQQVAPPAQHTPPPLDTKRSSTYVMKGSGEGRMESDVPWAATPEAEEAPAQPMAPQPAPDAGRVSFQLPAAAPEPETPAEPAAVAAPQVPKPKRTALWVVLVILLVGAGGFAAWYFVKQSRLLEGDTGDDPIKPAGIVPAEVSKDAGPADAGEGQAADGQPEKSADSGAEVTKTAEKEEKKEEPGKKKKRRKRKKKEVAKREPVKRPAELALEYYKKGNALIRKKRFKEAIGLFRKALKTNSKLAIAHRGLGICYAQMRDNKRACREYRIYLKMIPADSKEVPTLRQILKSCK